MVEKDAADSGRQCLLTYLEVDGSDDLWRGHLDGQRHELALHARRDVERPGRGVHAGDVLALDDLLEQDLDLVIPD